MPHGATGLGGTSNYHSRVLEYQVDETKKVAKVVWEFPGTFAVDAWYFGGCLQHLGLGHDEYLAKMMVEALRQVAADFDVLNLVFADRHNVGVVRQNVGRHQHRIRE